MDTQIFKVVAEWPFSHVYLLCRLFRVCQLSRCFIRNFNTLAAPLALAKKSTSGFSWTAEAQGAFDTILERLTMALVHGRP